MIFNKGENEERNLSILSSYKQIISSAENQIKGIPHGEQLNLLDYLIESILYDISTTAQAKPLAPTYDVRQKNQSGDGSYESVCARERIDLTHGEFTTDGLYWYGSQATDTPCAVNDFRFAAVYTLTQMKQTIPK